MQRILARIAQHAGIDVEEYLPVIGFAQWRVVLVAQAIVQGQVGSYLPFVLRIGDVILLLGESLPGRAVEERGRRRQVAEELH